MNGYLIAEEGPLIGATLAFEEKAEKKEWIMGRDPDVADVVLEDPMVSRKHVIMRLTHEGFTLENLSSVNPATQNGMIIAEPVLLKEGDIIQIGNTFFRFTETPIMAIEPDEPVSTTEDFSSFVPPKETRWMIKVISGPNAGAEFSMKPSSTYILGKDPNVCDVVFQDLSVSRQHAKFSVDDQENVFIEDLGSRNGVIINGELISAKRKLESEDLVGLGTTTFIVVDRHKARETIISAPPAPAVKEEKMEEAKAARAPKHPKDWREIIMPKKHLILAGVFAFLILICLVSMFSLFKAEPVLVKHVDEKDQVQDVVKQFPGIQYSFNQPSGKLFLVGHVLTAVDKQELTYLLKELPFIQDIEDNVVIDEFVWQNMNALLARNPNWVGVSLYSPTAGKFVLRGYLKTLDEAESLSDYVNLNFPYLDRLDNQIVVESNLVTEIQSLLAEKGFANVTFQFSNGEIVLSGIAEDRLHKEYNELLQQFKVLPGIRLVKNYVVMTSLDTSRVDLTSQYQVTGNSRQDNMDFFVVINGHIFGMGDILDGMKISKIESNLILLEKDGLKYKINYNLQ